MLRSIIGVPPTRISARARFVTHHQLDKINAELFAANAACAGRVQHFVQLDSTNGWLLAQPEIHARACIAERQTAGRGQRGKAWHTPKSSAVLLSLGWDLGDADPAGLSLLAGLALVDGIRRVNGPIGAELKLKWPNDVLARGRKLAGILTELRGRCCVIGIGLNVSAVPPQVNNAIAVNDLGAELGRDALAVSVLITLGEYLQQFCERGFAAFAPRWNALDAHAETQVSVQFPHPSSQKILRGIARGVDSRGALRVTRAADGAAVRVISGSLRIC